MDFRIKKNIRDLRNSILKSHLSLCRQHQDLKSIEVVTHRIRTRISIYELEFLESLIERILP